MARKAFVTPQQYVTNNQTQGGIASAMGVPPSYGAPYQSDVSMALANGATTWDEVVKAVDPKGYDPQNVAIAAGVYRRNPMQAHGMSQTYSLYQDAKKQADAGPTQPTESPTMQVTQVPDTTGAAAQPTQQPYTTGNIDGQPALFYDEKDLGPNGMPAVIPKGMWVIKTLDGQYRVYFGSMYRGNVYINKRGGQEWKPAPGQL